jgi:DNA repair exonuclease SbcCD ATPase subunit
MSEYPVLSLSARASPSLYGPFMGFPEPVGSLHIQTDHPRSRCDPSPTWLSHHTKRPALSFPVYHTVQYEDHAISENTLDYIHISLHRRVSLMSLRKVASSPELRAGRSSHENGSLQRSQSFPELRNLFDQAPSHSGATNRDLFNLHSPDLRKPTDPGGDRLTSGENAPAANTELRYLSDLPNSKQPFWQQIETAHKKSLESSGPEQSPWQQIGAAYRKLDENQQTIDSVNETLPGIKQRSEKLVGQYREHIETLTRGGETISDQIHSTETTRSELENLLLEFRQLKNETQNILQQLPSHCSPLEDIRQLPSDADRATQELFLEAYHTLYRDWTDGTFVHNVLTTDAELTLEKADEATANIERKLPKITEHLRQLQESIDKVDKPARNVEEHLKVGETNGASEMTPIDTQLEAIASVRTELENDLAELQARKETISEELTDLINIGQENRKAKQETRQSAIDTVATIKDMRRRRAKTVHHHYNALYHNHKEKLSEWIKDAKDHKTSLEDILGKFNQGRKMIVSEINKVSSMNHPIENYHELRSEIAKMGDELVKEELLAVVDQDHTQWQQWIDSDQEEFLTDATLQLTKMEEWREDTRGLLSKMMEIYDRRTKSSKPPSPEELRQLLNERRSKMQENGEILEAIEERDQPPAEYGETLEDIIYTEDIVYIEDIEERDQPPAEYLESLLEVPTRKGGTTQDWLKSVKLRKTELNDTLESFYIKKDIAVEKINKLFSVTNPVEDIYGLYAEIGKIGDSVLASDHREEVDFYKKTWKESQKPKRDTLLQSTITDIKEYNKAIEKTKKALNDVTEIHYQLIDENLAPVPLLRLS